MEIEMPAPPADPHPRLFHCPNLLRNTVSNFLWNYKIHIVVSCFLIVGFSLSINAYMFPNHPVAFCNKKIFVSSDGSEKYRTISQAVDASEDHNPLRTCIIIKAGEYDETVTVPMEKINLAFLGDGKKKTVIKSHNLYLLTNIGTLNVEGRGFLGRDLTITNTASYEEGEAVALKNSADESIFYRCNFIGYKRTLYAVARKQFYRDNQIQGSSYFIYGAAEAFFQHCSMIAVQSGKDEIVVSGNVRSSPNQDSAFVFHLCDFVTSEVIQPVYLGTPLTAYSTVVVMESFINGSVYGWRLFSKGFADCTNSSFLAEFRNYGPGARLEGSSPCTPKMEMSIAQQFTLRNFFKGSLWIPKQIPHMLDLLS